MDEQEDLTPEEAQPETEQEQPVKEDIAGYWFAGFLGAAIMFLVCLPFTADHIRWTPEKHTGPVTVVSQGAENNFVFRRPNGEQFIMDLEYKNTPVLFCPGTKIQDIVYKDGHTRYSHEEFVKAKFAQDSK